jgi:branched-chain amino acid aminotransferase
MQTTETIWLNGKLIPWHEAKIHILTHTLHYGGGAFEGIRVYPAVQGPAIFRLEEHVERFFYSCVTLKMPITYSQNEMIEAIKNVVRVNQLTHGYIRPIAFYGYGNMKLDPINSPVEVAIACWPWGAYLPHESIDIKTSNYIRIHPDSTVSDAKLCGHYVNSILATLDLQGTHYHEALFLDANGNIAEGTGENFFMIKNKVIYTPKLGGILAGITRHTVIQLAQGLGLSVVETDLKPEDAYAADECFFTGTAAEVTPIRSIDDKVISEGVGEITAQIKEAYLAVVHGRNADFVKYLTVVS